MLRRSRRGAARAARRGGAAAAPRGRRVAPTRPRGRRTAGRPSRPRRRPRSTACCASSCAAGTSGRARRARRSAAEAAGIDRLLAVADEHQVAVVGRAVERHQQPHLRRGQVLRLVDDDRVEARPGAGLARARARAGAAAASPSGRRAAACRGSAPTPSHTSSALGRAEPASAPGPVDRQVLVERRDAAARRAPSRTRSRARPGRRSRRRSPASLRHSSSQQLAPLVVARGTSAAPSSAATIANTRLSTVRAWMRGAVVRREALEQRPPHRRQHVHERRQQHRLGEPCADEVARAVQRGDRLAGARARRAPATGRWRRGGRSAPATGAGRTSTPRSSRAARARSRARRARRPRRRTRASAAARRARPRRSGRPPASACGRRRRSRGSARGRATCRRRARAPPAATPSSRQRLADLDASRERAHRPIAAAVEPDRCSCGVVNTVSGFSRSGSTERRVGARPATVRSGSGGASRGPR